MDPNAMRFGNASPLLGGTQSIQSGIPAIEQVGGASPISQPLPQQPPSGVMGQMPPQGMGLPTGSDEATIILNALTTRLKHNSKVQEAQLPKEPQLPTTI